MIDDGSDSADIARSARAVYRECKTQHIDEQLAAVIRAACGRGAFAAIGRGITAVWTPDPSHALCSDCNDNTLAGAVAAGEAVPTGHFFPPAHVGCRCMLLPAGD